MKRFYIFLSLFILILSLTGCGLVTQVNLTESEEERIVEYASQVVLKHDKNYKGGLVDTQYTRELDARVEALKEMERNLKEEEAAANEAEDGEPDETAQDDAVVSKYSPRGEQDIAKALSQDGFSISFTGFEKCSQYPYDGSEGGYFSMDAAPGMELVVFHFRISNVSEEERECNILNRDAFFRIIVNGTECKNALTTLLANDLATVDENLIPEEYYDAVVVLEAQPGYADSITEASLLIKGQDEDSIIPIYGGM